jgi:hypothetical protein
MIFKKVTSPKTAEATQENHRNNYYYYYGSRWVKPHTRSGTIMVLRGDVYKKRKDII